MKFKNLLTLLVYPKETIKSRLSIIKASRSKTLRFSVQKTLIVSRIVPQMILKEFPSVLDC